MIDPLKVTDIKDVRYAMISELRDAVGYEKAKEMVDKIDNIELAKRIDHDQVRGYYFCVECWKFHPGIYKDKDGQAYLRPTKKQSEDSADYDYDFREPGQKRCSLPCLTNEQSNQRTEDEYEEIYNLFEPESYTQDDAHLNFPHSRIFKWMSEAELIYNTQLKRGIEPLRSIAFHYKLSHININDFENAARRTEFEKALRLQELRRFDNKYGKPEPMERFWVNVLKLARAATELMEIENKYNELLNNGDVRLKAIAGYYGLVKIRLSEEGESVFEVALRRQELRKMIPERYGEPLDEERFWRWAEGYGKQEVERREAMKGIEHKFVPEKYESSLGKRYT